jgi:hypothetical protein
MLEKQGFDPVFFATKQKMATFEKPHAFGRKRLAFCKSTVNLIADFTSVITMELRHV